MSRAKRALKNSFIPHEGNDNRPYVLRPKAIAFICALVLVAESAFVFGAKYLAPQSTLYGIIEANALVDETNQNRVANDLPDLQVSPLLQTAAQDKANDMVTKGYFAHTSPQGLTPWYWFEQVGYNFDYAGENLAVNFSDSEDVTNAWMNSPEHRANILSANFTQIGIATAQGIYNGEPATYVVEEFGTPAPAIAPVAFVNTASAATAPATNAAAATTPAPVTAKKSMTSAPVKPAPAATPTAATVPTVVAIQNSQTTSSQQSFVAVQGASTQAVPTAASAVTANGVAPAVQSNIIQTLFSNPKTVTDDFYLLLMVIFGLALVLNIFINIRVQYPRLIASGLLVIVVAGLCVMLNQNIGFLHVIVL